MNILATIVLACGLSLAGGAFAQSDIEQQRRQQVTQPGNNAPVWRDVRAGETHYTTDRGREAGVLVQSAGETWRQIRNGPVTFYGGWLVVLVALAIFAFYAAKGPVRLQGRPTGRLVRRFGALERLVHWSTATSFCLLGLTGLAMLFGKHIVLPLVGHGAFGWLAAASKLVHNFVAPLFIVSVATMVLVFLRDNLPRAHDWKWLGKVYGIFARGEHVPSGRFNAGEKGWFWLGVVGLSIVVIWSGLILLFPNFDQTRAVMQEAWVWHASAALVYIALSLGHIYLGTLGLEGSYRAMASGYVDETWAKEHHAIWYEEQRSAKEHRRWTAKRSTSPSASS